MNRPALYLTLAALTASVPALGAGPAPRPPELHKLDVSLGRWVFRGRSLDTAFGKAGTWSWHEDCRWSPDRLFLECSFDNVWSGKPVRSLVVDTYNTEDKTYWHYEFFAAGTSGKHPFVSRMTIDGDTWTEYGSEEHAGKSVKERIVYHFISPTRVEVEIRISPDGRRWTTIDRGEGTKLQ